MQQTKKISVAQGVKEVIQTTTRISAYIISAAIVFSIAAFANIFIPVDSEDVLLSREEYGLYKLNRKEAREKLYVYLNETTQSDKQLLSLFKDLVEKEEMAATSYRVLKAKKQDQQIFGFYSLNKFVYALGMPLVILILSLTLFFINQNHKITALKRSLDFLTISGMSISFFYLTWIFYPALDLPRGAYFLSMAFVSSLMTFFCVFVIKHVKLSRNNIAELVSTLFYTRDNHVKPLTKLALKYEIEVGVGKRKQHVKKLAEDYDKEIFTTVQKVLK
ncbi:MAG: hypothetical protein ACPGR7_01790 [Flavobacteriaceae bacterium]